jgi:hypothetical protein
MGTTIQEQRNFHLELVQKLTPKEIQRTLLTPYSYGKRGGCCVVCLEQYPGLKIEIALIHDPAVPGLGEPHVHVSKWVGNMRDGYKLTPTDTILKFDDTFKEKFFEAMHNGFMLKEVV